MKLYFTALALAAISGEVQSAPDSPPVLAVVGGELDPAFNNIDVYVQTPPSAPIPPTRACQLAARYVELINRGDYLSAAGLYADDATFLEPMRPSLKGRNQIDGFYTKTIGPMKPHVIAVTYLGNDRECMVSLANQVVLSGRPRYMLASIDHFTLRDDGKVGSMVAYARPR